ncbi:MAG: hypothetical protein NC930_09410, partial [Candidatus Omnitrophica bacterium]|nr:hypothetical protein [Candidatus Omnitrophota bacterium]
MRSVKFKLCFLCCLIGVQSVLVALSFAAEDSASRSKTASPDIPSIERFPKKEYQVEVVADRLEYSQDQKKAIATGNVVITYQDYRITADYAEVETDTKQSYAKGHVLLFEGDDARAYGNEVHYDFDKNSGSFPDGRFLNAPWYSTGKDVQQIRKGYQKVQNGGVTTCSSEHPHYE